MTASVDRYSLLKDFAKRQRNNPTLAESFLWAQLKGGHLGVKFQRQHIIYDYIADFVCLEESIIVEVDGGYHFVGDQILKDTERTEFLESLGFKVIRFTNEEVLYDTNNVTNRIKKFLTLN